MNPRDDVILSYSNLAPEQTSSGNVCPDCRGGRHRERSLNVGRTGPWLWWRCHRASCDFHGKHRVTGVGDYPETTDERRGRYREFKRMPLPQAMKKGFAEQFHLDEETFDQAGWSYTPNYDGHGARVIMPIFNPAGAVRGEMFRSYSGDLPKGLINGELAEEQICWYKFRKYCKHLVVVEDQPSALRVAAGGVHSLALCGTTLNLARVLEIREHGYSKVYLCLDDDATAQAIKHVREFRNHLPSLRIKALSGSDIKDMSPKEFALFIHEVLT
jgi:hypothetical protein